MFDGIYGLNVYTISLSFNAFDRQFHWDMVLVKNDYLYSFVFRSLCKTYVIFASKSTICRY